MTDDLTTRLLAAIEAAEASARRQDEHLSGHDRPYNLEDPTDPAVVLRHCAAHRKIVAECRGLSSGVLKVDLVAALGDLVLALLAEGYDLTTEPAP